MFHFWWRSFFLVFTWIWEKKCSVFGEDRFFGPHLICSSEEYRGRGSSFPMFKMGQNGRKIANYPPNAQQWSALLVPGSVVFNNVVRCWCKRKMLKRNWNWRNNRLFCHIFVISEMSLGGEARLAKPMHQLRKTKTIFANFPRGF